MVFNTMNDLIKTLSLTITASFLIVVKRFFFLALKPYKTMRLISMERDVAQIGIIFFFVLIYFLVADVYRAFTYPPFILFLFVIIHVCASALFFYGISFLFGSKQKDIYRHIMTFTYALVPTLIWFFTTLFLYILLPPPRYPSFNGKLFTVVYITFSVSMLLWKIILTYLAIRFSTHMKVSRIVYSFLLYIIVVCVYAVCMYELQFFRIPFL